jgi:hypothetical protein
VLGSLAFALLDKPRARREAKEVEEDLAALDRFYRHEALKLARACERTGETRWPVPQIDRDVLMLRARHAPA